MLEPLALDLISGGIDGIGGVDIQKIRDILRRKRFSEEIDALTTEFATALKTTIADALGGEDREYSAELNYNWTTIAEELNELDVLFENEQEAIVRVTEAVGASLDIDLDAHPDLRGDIEAAVADAYQVPIREFANRVAGSDVADIFTPETNIELTATVPDPRVSSAPAHTNIGTSISGGRLLSALAVLSQCDAPVAG